MSNEDLLINIDINAKRGKKGVDDLTKSLKQNTRQTKMMQEEMKRLEKEYKSIATAAKKLPAKELSKLQREAKKAGKETARLGRQFDKTAKKMDVVKERIVSTEEAMGVLAATAITLGSLDGPIRFTNRMRLGANAVHNLVNNTIPAMKAVKDLADKGFGRLSKSMQSSKAAFDAFGPALREQKALHKGVQLAAVRTGDFMQKFNIAIKEVDSGFNFLRRSMILAQKKTETVRKSLVRIKASFAIVAETVEGTVHTIQAFRSAWFGTFGTNTGGAAQVNKFSLLILNMQYRLENLSKVIKSSVAPAFAAVSGVGTSAFDKLSKAGSRALAVILTPIYAISDGVVGIVTLIKGRLIPALLSFGSTFVAVATTITKTLISGVLSPIFHIMKSLGQLRTLTKGLSIVPAVAVTGIWAAGQALLALRKTALLTFQALFSISQVFSTFGAASGGAAQVNKIQQILLNVQYAAELAGKAIRENFAKAMKVAATQVKALGNAVSTTSKQFAGKLLPAILDLAKSGATKAITTIRAGLISMGPAIIGLAEKGKTLAAVFDNKLAASFANALKFTSQLGVKSITLSQRLGLINKGLIGAVEGSNLFGVGALGLGAIIKSTDSKVLDFIGTVVQLAGVLSLSLGAAITFTVGAIGQLSIAIGDKLLSAMDKWEKKFEKAQSITKAFEFVIKGFGRTLGTEAVGGLQFWNEQTDTLIKNTAIGSQEIQKSIKILVAEGAVLGISAEQNAKILQRATDIAESSKRPLSEVTLAMAKALAGTAGTLDSLGVFTDKATISHSKYAEASGVVIDKLDKHGKALLVMNSIFEQTEARVGAAADQLDTITGATKQYEAAVETLQARLGSQNVFFVKLKQAQTAVVQGFTNFSPILIDAISLMTDFLGVTLKVVGTFLTLWITLGTIKSAYEILNIVIAKSTAAKAALNFVTGVLAAKLNITTIAITNLKTALIAMSQVGIAAVKAVVTGLNKALLVGTKRVIAYTASLLFTKAGWVTLLTGAKAATIAIAKFTAVLLTNPIFLAVSAILLLIKAYNDLSKELKQLMGGLEETGVVAKETGGLFKWLGGIGKRVFSALVNAFKIVVIHAIALKEGIKGIVIGFQKFWAVVTRNKKRLQELSEEAKAVQANIRELRGASVKAFTTILKGVEDTAMAAEGLGHKLEQTAEAARGFSIAMVGGFDKQSLSLQVLGDDVDRTLETFLNATTTLNKVRDSFRAGGDKAATEKDVGKAAADRERARLGVIKLRRDALIDLERIRAANITKELEDSGKVIDAIQRQGVIRLAEFSKRIKSLEKIAAFTEKERKLIKDVEAGIKATTAAEAARAQAKIDEEKEKALEKQKKLLKSLTKEIEALNLANLSSGGELEALANAQHALRIAELDTLQKKLDAQKGITAELKAAGTAAIAAAKNAAADKLQLQIDEAGLINQLDKVFKGLKADNLFGDSIKGLLAGSTQFAKNIRSTIRFIKGTGPILLPSDATISDFMKAMEKAAKPLFKRIFTRENLLAAGKSMAQGLVDIFDMFGSFFDPAVINGLAGSLDKLGSLPDELLKAFNKLLSSMDKIITGLSQALGRLISQLPTIIAKLFQAIPKLITALFDALDKFLVMLPHIFQSLLDKLPEVLAAFLERLPQTILLMLNAVGKIISSVISSLPDIFVEIMAALPSIIESVVEGLVSAMGDIAAAFVDFLIGGGIEKIVGAFLRAIPKIALALVVGFAKGLSRALGAIFGTIKIPTQQFQDAGAAISDGFKAGFAQVTGEAGKLFQVLDFEDPAKGLDPAAQTAKLAEQVFEAFTQGANLLGRMIKFLKKVWDRVIKFFKKLGSMIKAAWDGIINFFMEFGNFILGAFEPIMAFFGLAFGVIVENVFAPIIRFFTEEFFSLASEPFKAVVRVFQELPTIILESFSVVQDFFENMLAGEVEEAFSGVFNFFEDTFQTLVSEAFKGPFEEVGTVMSNVGVQIFEGFRTVFNKNLGMYTTAGNAILNGLKSGLTSLTSIFTGFGTSIFNSLKSLISGGDIANLFKSIFNTLSPKSIMSKIFSTTGDTSGKGKVEKIIGIDVPFANFAAGGRIAGTAKTAGDSLKNDTVPALLSPGEFIVPRSIAQDPDVSKMLDALLAGDLPGFGFGGKVGGAISGASKRSGLSSAASSASSGITGGFKSVTSALDPATEILKHLGEALEDMMSFNAKTLRAKSGGLVNGFSSGDGTKALLQPGEFVVNRTGVRALGLGTLGAANLGQGGGNNVTNIDMNLDIQTTEAIDEAFVRNRLIPAVKEDLKQSSLRGDFLMSKKGLRA